MAQKRIIQGQPSYTETSQYNFSDDYSIDPPNYQDSSGLPANSDKFTRKDLCTIPKGDELNEAIIDRNLKFAGGNFIRIDTLRIVNAGVSHDIKNIKVEGYLFSQAAFDPLNPNGSIRGYGTVRDGVREGNKRFFSYSQGNVSEGNDIGNLKFLEGENILSNLAVTYDSSDTLIPPKNGDFNNFDSSYDVADSFKIRETDQAVLDGMLTQVFDELQINPIYIVIYMKGDADRWFGTDIRKKKHQVFKIDNQLQIFKDNGDGTYSGQIISHDELYNKSTTGDGGGGYRSAESAAWRVSDLQVTINTLPGGTNNWEGTEDEIGNDEADYEKFFEAVQPPTNFIPTDNNPRTFLNIGPDRQLFNTNPSGQDKSTFFPDYFPKTTVGVLDGTTGQMSANFIDLQSYYENDGELSIQASTPATITFDFQMVNPTDSTMQTIITGTYFYFVIHWNDIENEYGDLQDFLNKRPDNLVELLDAQEEGLYIIREQEQLNNGTSNYNTLPLKHTYNSPGIKNLKIVVFNYNQSEGGVGRWKLVNCRFFLDIPINQYPDFGELGGTDYTTIPWPFTTPIIGGVDKDSKYKKSVEQALSSGNIGDVDIIDERFLVYDLENDVMGKSINLMDLEQVRYFNKPYGINELLEIPTSFVTPDTSDGLLGTLPFPEFQEEFDIVGDFDDILGEVNVSDSLAWTVVGRPDIFNYINSLVNDGIIDSIPRASDAGVTPRPVEDFYNPTYGNPYYDNLYNDFNFWNALTPETTFSKESSVGQIFIIDNLDSDLVSSCQFEFNTGNLSNKSIYDSCGNNNQGFLMGNYRVKKMRKGEPMTRDSFIKVPKKTVNRNGAL